jgi:hypothetical protein
MCYEEKLEETKAFMDAIREEAPETPILYVMTHAENRSAGPGSQHIMVRSRSG